MQMQAPHEPAAFTRQETAQILRMSLRTLDNAKARGAIGYVQAGGKILFRNCDIESYLARHAIPPRESSWAIN